jgi:hypothetical protein
MKPTFGIFASALILPSIWPLVTPACADDLVHKCIEISEAAVCSRLSSSGALHCPPGKRAAWVNDCVKTGGSIANEHFQMMRDALGHVEHRRAFEANSELER